MQDCKIVTKNCVFEGNVLSGLGFTMGIEPLSIFFNQRPVTAYIGTSIDRRKDAKQTGWKAAHHEAPAAACENEATEDTEDTEDTDAKDEAM